MYNVISILDNIIVYNVHCLVRHSMQKYLTALRKEKEAFQQLIREKAVSSEWCVL